MREGWRKALFLGAVLAPAASCAPPYRPACRVVSSAVLDGVGDRPDALSPGPGGEVALVSTTASAAGGEATALVVVFDVSGQVQRRHELPVPAATTGFERLQGRRVIDTADGVAALYTRWEQVPTADGGVATLAHQLLDFRFVDGGARTVEVTDGGVIGEPTPADLYRVGASVIAGLYAGHGWGLLGVSRLVGWSGDGTPLAAGLDLAAGSPLWPGPDALVVAPAPGLVSERLEVLGPLPALSASEPVSPPAVAWSLADRVAWTAVVEDGSLLLGSFDFDGAPRGPPARVSSALTVSAVAHSAHGLGVVFGDTPTAAVSQVVFWFAFVDAEGRKRGPDVALPVDFNPGDFLAASPTDDRFGLFTQGSAGLTLTEVRCE